MKLHGCNVVVKKNRDYPDLYVVEIGEYDDNIDRFTAFEIRKQILSNQEDTEKLRLLLEQTDNDR